MFQLNNINFSIFLASFSMKDNKTKVFYDLEMNRRNQKTNESKTTMYNQRKQILRHFLRILLLSVETPTNEFNNESQYSTLFRTSLQIKLFPT